MKKWTNYKIIRYPIHERYRGFTHYEYNPQYFNKQEKRWRPYTIITNGRVEPRLYKTRMEAEQWIEIQLIKEKREKNEFSR